MAKPAQVFCPVCGAEYIWETERSWWLLFDRCYACPDPQPINGDLTASDSELLEVLSGTAG